MREMRSMGYKVVLAVEPTSEICFRVLALIVRARSIAVAIFSIRVMLTYSFSCKVR